MTKKVLQRLSYMFSYTSEDIIRKKKNHHCKSGRTQLSVKHSKLRKSASQSDFYSSYS